MISKQSQKGGDDSNNFQSENMVVQVGIDEKRAREIYKEMILQVKDEFTAEAYEIANKRVIEFENRLMPKMEDVEGALQAFSDPGFQLLLVEAQKTASATERPADYDLLSELLVHRFQKGENRNVRAGINRAVKVVDEISDEALLGLTAIYVIHRFTPTTGDIYEGLDILNNVFEKVLYGKLPLGSDWIEHLEILDAIRVQSSISMKKLEVYYSEQMHGYTDVGIKKESEDYIKSIEILKDNGLPESVLVEHILNPEFVRIPVAHRQAIESLKCTARVPHEGQPINLTIPLSESQKKALYTVYGMYNKDEGLKHRNIIKFREIIDNRANLSTLRNWWESLEEALKITAVGEVLAHSNAQRCDKNIPALE